MKTILTSFIIFLSLNLSTIARGLPEPEPEPPPEEPAQPPPTSPKNPTATVTSITKIIGNVGASVGGSVGKNMGGNGFNAGPDASGDFGLTNLSLSSGVTFTSFDDTTVGSSGHFRDYSLSLSGDLTEDDRINISLSNSRFETGGTNSLLARTYGITVAWVHSLNENYGIGAFGLLNSVDIEEINGNTYSYGYGLLFTTYYDFKQFSLSSVTALAHTDFDTGYDQLFMSSWTFSKQWTDKFTSYLTLAFTDSLKSDPDGDPTYGSWEIGGTYYINDNFSVGIGFQRTEFLNNYSDNTLLLNVGWLF